MKRKQTNKLTDKTSKPIDFTFDKLNTSLPLGHTHTIPTSTHYLLIYSCSFAGAARTNQLTYHLASLYFNHVVFICLAAPTPPPKADKTDEDTSSGEDNSDDEEALAENPAGSEYQVPTTVC